jgi:hypothetical protein
LEQCDVTRPHKELRSKTFVAKYERTCNKKAEAEVQSRTHKHTPDVVVLVVEEVDETAKSTTSNSLKSHLVRRSASTKARKSAEGGATSKLEEAIDRNNHTSRWIDINSRLLGGTTFTNTKNNTSRHLTTMRKHASGW